jgi:hypothetical protein
MGISCADDDPFGSSAHHLQSSAFFAVWWLAVAFNKPTVTLPTAVGLISTAVG